MRAMVADVSLNAHVRIRRWPDRPISAISTFDKLSCICETGHVLCGGVSPRTIAISTPSRSVCHVLMICKA